MNHPTVCYEIVKTDTDFDEPDSEVLDNSVFLNREDAVKSAEDEFERYLERHPYIGTSFGSGVERDPSKGV